jgi:hypothetical protein
MPSLISDIEFVIGRGQQYDPAIGATQYRNPALKNRSYRPSVEGLGFLASSKFEIVNDTVNDVYGFNLLGGLTFQNGETWFVSLFSNEFITDLNGAVTLIDTTYFIRNVYIPQAVNDAAVKNKVEEFISIHEPEVLKDLFGYPFFKEFFEDVTGPTPTQKYEDLLFGAEYTDGNGYTQKWMGFVNPQKLSILANYVYYHYITNLHTLTTAGGESKQKAEGGNRTDSGAKAARAWNEMRRWIKELLNYLDARKEDYPLFQEYSFPHCKFESINVFGI